MPSAIRIDEAELLHVVHGAEEVDDFLVAPVGEDRFLIRAAAAVAAAIVHRDDDVAVGGKELALEVERVLVLAVRAAMDAEQRGIASARHERRRLDDEAVDVGAVLARRREIFGRSELHASEPRVVLVVSLRSCRPRAHGLPAASSRSTRARRSRRPGRARVRDDPRGPSVSRSTGPPAAADLADDTAAGRPTNANEQRRPSADHGRRTDRRSSDVGQDARRPARSRDHRELRLIVGGILHLVAEQIRDLFAVRAPREPARSPPPSRRQARGLRARRARR